MNFCNQCIRWLADRYRGQLPLDHTRTHVLKDKKNIKMLLLPGASRFDYAKEGFSPQADAHHLNSSQTFCINLFEPLRKSRLDVLEALLRIWGISLRGRIVRTEYEKTLSSVENTHFDFYIETDVCERVFVEVKYTEAKFGQNPKWRDEEGRMSFYEKWLSYSRNLSDMLEASGIAEFKSRYQLLRNISYVRSDSDFVLFLFPYSSKTLADEYHGMQEYLGVSKMQNVYSANTERFAMDVSDAIKHAGKPSPRLVAHYKRLDRVYFGWLHNVEGKRNIKAQVKN